MRRKRAFYFKNKMSEFKKGHKINLGIKRSEEYCNMKSKVAKKQWKNPIIRKRMSKAIKKACKFRNMRGEYSTRWKGGIKVDKSGYILKFSPKHPSAREHKYILEYRLVVEKQIGRYLKPKEIVHHINGIKNDNRIENLIIFKNHFAHHKWHMIQIGVKPEEIIFDGRNIKH